MRSADEAALVDTVYGTNLNTSAAACAKRVVDGCKIVLDGDSAVGTGLLTLHTADTAILTVLAHVCALVVIGALNNNALGVVDKVDNAVRTVSHTDTAADTLLGVNTSNAVLDFDSVLRANDHTVAVAKTSVGAKTVATVCHISGKTGLVTVIAISLLNDIAGAVAGNVCNLLYNVGRLNSEDSRNFLSGTVTAGNTEVGRGRSTVSESLGVAVTARVATSTAVCTGKAVTDSNRPLVLLHCEENR